MLKLSENELQEYIWNNRNDISKVISDFPKFELFPVYLNEGYVSPEKILHNLLIEKLEDLHSKVSSMEIFASEVPLPKGGESTIRADMLATFPDSHGIGIIELKKSKNTEKGAFTQLLAYSNYFSSIFPGATKGDLVLILIAPMDTRLVKEAYIQSLLFDNRDVVAFIPELDETKNAKLTLRPWIPSFDDISLFTKTAFCESNLSVCKVVWEHSEGIWNPEKGQSPEPYMVNHMNHISAIAGQMMEKIGVHGFAYCSQLWPELAEPLPFTNSLIIVGVNPYAVANSNYHLKKGQYENAPYPLQSLEEIIPSLLKSKNYEPDEFDRMDILHANWDGVLHQIAAETIDTATLQIDGFHPMTSSGFMTWDQYQVQITEDVFCTNFAVRPTGIYRDLHSEITKHDYWTSINNKEDEFAVPRTIFHLGIETLVSHNSFRQFINFMFNSDEIV